MSNIKTTNAKLRPEFENKGVQKKQFLPIKKLSNFGRLLLWLFATYDDKRQIFMMISAFSTMIKKNGSVFLVQYLKESHRLTLQALAGTPQECKTFPRVATRRGLPLIIPGPLRLHVERRDTVRIQLVLSLLSVYRVLKIPATLKIETITDSFKGLSPTLPEFEIVESLKALRVKYNFIIFKDAELMPTCSAGPNSKTSVLGATIDAWAFKQSPLLHSSFKILSQTTGPNLSELLDKEIEYLPTWFSLLKSGVKEELESKLKLGKLSQKLEAAGKVRIFGITDVWTQSLLRPLHDAILRSLSTINMDGTFDQLRPIRLLYDQGYKEMFSFDLTAATDRLPIQLQKQVLAELTSKEFADHWANLLVGRPWYLKFVPYYYSVGQPMGALSSWGMLALTHHVMVQVAARRAGKLDFKAYALLGDDLVIADKAVADVYLSLARDLGIEINLFKSLVSETAVSEFAKRIFRDGDDLSPLPPKLVLSLLRGLRNLPNVVRDMVSRGLSVQTEVLLRDATVKPNVLWEIIGPLGFVDSGGLSPFLGDRALLEDELRRLCFSCVTLVNRKLIRAFYDNQNRSMLLISKLTNLIYDGVYEVIPQHPDKYVKEFTYVNPSGTESQFVGFQYPGNVEPILVDFSYPLDTPALQFITQLLIEKVTTLNSTQPNQLVMPEGPYTYESTALFIKQAYEKLDSLDGLAIPDLTIKQKPAQIGQGKMKFYRELDAEFNRNAYKA